MATPEQLARARKLARFSPKTGKRGKGVKTLQKEMLEESYMDVLLERVQPVFGRITQAQIDLALGLRVLRKGPDGEEWAYTQKPNVTAINYIMDRMLAGLDCKCIDRKISKIPISEVIKSLGIDNAL